MKPGPLDQLKTPEQLTARVVDPGPPLRLLGYDLEADLARHYSLGELLLLTGSGQLPEPAAARALEVALTYLAGVTVAEAPGHAALLSRVCGTPFRSTLAIAALALTEEGAFVLEEHAAWLEWLARPEAERSAPPRRFLASSDEDRQSVGRLQAALQAIPFPVSALQVDPARTAALLAVLCACGLGADAILTLWVLARLPAVAAEAAAARRLSFSRYPINLPPVDHGEEP